jgi:hypothetical protein
MRRVTASTTEGGDNDESLWTVDNESQGMAVPCLRALYRRGRAVRLVPVVSREASRQVHRVREVRDGARGGIE